MKHCLKPKRTLRAKIKALDEWYPSFEDGTVLVCYHIKQERLSVWGDDDFGMEKIEVKNRDLFDIIKKQGWISVDWCAKNGFIPA